MRKEVYVNDSGNSSDETSIGVDGLAPVRDLTNIITRVKCGRISTVRNGLSRNLSAGLLFNYTFNI